MSSPSSASNTTVLLPPPPPIEGRVEPKGALPPFSSATRAVTFTICGQISSTLTLTANIGPPAGFRDEAEMMVFDQIRQVAKHIMTCDTKRILNTVIDKCVKR